MLRSRAAWQNPRVITVVFVVLLAGAIAGGLAMQKLLHESMHKRPDVMVF
jgi:uncharacterized protein YneF (UPF0154 family)